MQHRHDGDRDGRRRSAVTGTTETLYDRVAQAVAAGGGEFLVERTATGFDVQADVQDHRWVGAAYRAGIRELTIHHVAVDEVNGTCIVTDDLRAATWEAGAAGPKFVLRASMSRSLGTFRQVRRSYRTQVGADRRPETVLDHVFDSARGRKLVEREAAELGLEKRMNTPAKVGLTFAVLALVVALVALVVAAAVTLST